MSRPGERRDLDALGRGWPHGSTTDRAMGRMLRHASDARLEGHLRAPRRGVGARGEVGRRAGADRGDATAGCGCTAATATTSPSPGRAQHLAAGRPRPAGRRRDHRPQRARPPDFRMLQDRMHLRNAQSARRLAATIPATYMVFDLLRLDGEDLTRLPLGASGARGSRRSASTAAGRCRRCTTTARCSSTPPAAGARGRGQQAPVLDVRLRPPDRLLAQARPPAQRVVRGRRLAAAGGLHRRQPGRRAGGRDDRRRAALPRPGRQRHRPQGRRPAGQAAGRPRPRRQPVRRRGAEGRRAGHPLGRAVPRHRRRQPRHREEPAAAPAVLPRRAQPT